MHEQQFRTLANSISQLAWMADPEGYRFWYNDRWYDLHWDDARRDAGLGVAEGPSPGVRSNAVVERIKIAFAAGQPWEDIFPLRSRAENTAGFSRALFRSSTPKARWRAGSARTPILLSNELEQKLRESHDELGRRVANRTAELSQANEVLTEEIATRRRIQDELIKQTEILHSILKHMGDAVIVADLEQKFLVFNPAAERMFGKAPPATTVEEWSHQYGLYLPDMVTPFPPNELPLTRAISGEKGGRRRDVCPSCHWLRAESGPGSAAGP